MKTAAIKWYFPSKDNFFAFFSHRDANRAALAWPVQNSKLQTFGFFRSQMIMSYLYFASVLYLAVHPYKGDVKWRIISRSSNSTRDYGSRSQRIVWLLDKVNLAVHIHRLCDVCYTWGVGAEQGLENSFTEKNFSSAYIRQSLKLFSKYDDHFLKFISQHFFYSFKRERIT